MGCCGHSFPSAKKVQQAVEQNTQEFLAAAPQTEKEFLQFRDRRPAMDLRHGVCRNAVQLKGCVLCPLHPARHHENDLRIGHCDVHHFCATAKAFARWEKKKQDNFVQFILEKNLEVFAYSIRMDNGQLRREFETQRNSDCATSLL